MDQIIIIIIIIEIKRTRKNETNGRSKCTTLER